MIFKTILLSGINLSSKLLGLLKIILLASIYGAGSTYDAFIIAYTLPTILPQILTTIITTVFIPQFNKKDRSSTESWDGLNVLFTVIVIISFLLFIILYIYADRIVQLLAPGIDYATLTLATSLFRIMTVTTLVIGISSFFIALSNANEKFYLTSFDSLLINSLVITYCIVFMHDSSIHVISFLIVTGFTLHLLLLLYANRVLLLRNIKFNLDLRHDDFTEPMRRSLPIVIGYLGAISTGIIDQWFTSHEGTGSISVLSYAMMLHLLPMEVFGKAVMETYYTRFSKVVKNAHTLIMSYKEGIKIIVFIMFPTSLYLLFSNASLIEIMFERGSFTRSDTQLTSQVLSALSLGLMFRIITYFNYRLLHASNKSWIAISIGLFGVLVNVFFNYILSKEYGLIGIALATTISLFVSTLASCLFIKKIYNIEYGKFVNLNFMKILSITVISLMVYNTIIDNYSLYTEISNHYIHLIYNVIFILFIPLIFLSLGYLIKVNEIVDAVKYLRNR